MRTLKQFICLFALAIFVAACKPTSDPQHVAPSDSLAVTIPAEASVPVPDSTVQFLLDASAEDFYAHQPPLPVDFRNVQVRNLIGEDAEDHFLICGEFLTQDQQGKDAWTAFATIKTSGYEQWIGNSSMDYCQDSKPVSYKGSDLAAALKSRLEALRAAKEVAR